MKKLLILIFLFPLAFCYAQNVGIGTSIPDPNAQLDIKSGNKGLLVPRMDSIARVMIPNTKGLLVFDTTTSSFWFNTGSMWKNLSSGEFWMLDGNMANSATKFLGTTNDQPLRIKINNQPAGLISRSQKNSFIGYQAGNADSIGTENTAIGFQSFFSDTSGSSNTAAGAYSLFSNTMGSGNTSIGHKSLYSNVSGIANTANGVQALFSNINGADNSAHGYQALYSNNSGNFNTSSGALSLFLNTAGAFNTANGALSLYSNNTGIYNTANGFQSMFSDSSGNFNTGSGAQSLFSNKSGSNNTANGVQSLYFDSSGNSNTASGYQAIYQNKFGSSNTASGYQALFSNTVGNQNTAMGSAALFNNTGSNNIAIGFNAGTSLSSGNNNIAIGHPGVINDSNTIRIGAATSKTFISGIFNSLTSASGIAVFVDASGQLGTISSSARFKQDIQNIGKSSEDIYRLRPVSFRYKEQVLKGDKDLQYGLIAEETEVVNPLLVAHDSNGSVYTIKYQLLTPLMLNELQKQHAENILQGELLSQQDLKIKKLEEEITRLKRMQEQIIGLLKSESHTK